MMKRYFFLAALAIAGCKAKQPGTAQHNGGIFKKKILKQVEVTGIRIDTFPRYGRDGESWDSWAPLSSDADLYAKILWRENVMYQSETKDECSWATPVKFMQGIPLVLKPFDQAVLLELFDEDGMSKDDNVGYIQFSPLDYEGKEEVQISNPTSDLKVTLSMRWTYE